MSAAGWTWKEAAQHSTRSPRSHPLSSFPCHSPSNCHSWHGVLAFSLTLLIYRNASSSPFPFCPAGLQLLLVIIFFFFFNTVSISRLNPAGAIVGSLHVSLLFSSIISSHKILPHPTQPAHSPLCAGFILLVI